MCLVANDNKTKQFRFVPFIFCLLSETNEGDHKFFQLLKIQKNPCDWSYVTNKNLQFPFHIHIFVSTHCFLLIYLFFFLQYFLFFEIPAFRTLQNWDCACPSTWDRMCTYVGWRGEWLLHNATMMPRNTCCWQKSDLLFLQRTQKSYW